MNEDNNSARPRPKRRRFAAVRDGEPGGVQYLVSRAEDGDGWGSWRRWGMENWERIRSGQSTIGWAELDQFVVDYGWLNLSFRYAIARPCWMLHPDVVEIVAMIYGGRKAYEAEREGMTMRGHADYLAALKDLIDAIENVFRVHGGDNCDVEKAEDGSWHALHTEVGWRWGDEERQPVNSWVGFPIPPSPLHAVASESAARRERSEDDELDAALRLSETEDLPRRSEPRPARGGPSLGR